MTRQLGPTTIQSSKATHLRRSAVSEIKKGEKFDGSAYWEGQEQGVVQLPGQEPPLRFGIGKKGGSFAKTNCTKLDANIILTVLLMHNTTCIVDELTMITSSSTLSTSRRILRLIRCANLTPILS